MTHKEVWIPPFVSEEYSWNITDSKHHMVFTALCEPEVKDRIIKLLNEDKSTEKFDTAYVDGCKLVVDNQAVGLFRGWGRLIGVGGLHLDAEVAAKLQDDFMLDCLEKLGKKFKLVKR